MNTKLLLLLVVGIWLGMVLGISFLEAPLKFKAPNISLTLGLGIGQLVFGALNKVELFFSVFLLAWLLFYHKNLGLSNCLYMGLPILIVSIQSIWLLPILNARIDHLLAGTTPPPSHHHFYYVFLEVLKVGGLIFSFTKLYHYE